MGKDYQNTKPLSFTKISSVFLCELCVSYVYKLSKNSSLRRSLDTNRFELKVKRGESTSVPKQLLKYVLTEIQPHPFYLFEFEQNVRNKANPGYLKKGINICEKLCTCRLLRPYAMMIGSKRYTQGLYPTWNKNESGCSGSKKVIGDDVHYL